VLINGDVYSKWTIVGKLEKKKREFLPRKEGRGTRNYAS